MRDLPLAGSALLLGVVLGLSACGNAASTGASGASNAPSGVAVPAAPLSPETKAPPASVPSPPVAPTSEAPPAPAPSVAPPPSSLEIPSIGVESTLVSLGLNADGTLAVPEGADYDKAAWFNGSPTPGSVGPSVLEGHVDSAAGGPSVFYRLGELEVGATVTVQATDGSRRDFVVTSKETYPKDAFPTMKVYGDTTAPELRLITCGGDFDTASGHYRDNTVVYARLA